VPAADISTAFELVPSIGDDDIVDALVTAGGAGVSHRGARTVGVVVSARPDHVVGVGVPP
jgi:hypothetical protein